MTLHQAAPAPAPSSSASAAVAPPAYKGRYAASAAQLDVTGPSGPVIYSSGRASYGGEGGTAGPRAVDQEQRQAGPGAATAPGDVD